MTNRPPLTHTCICGARIRAIDVSSFEKANRATLYVDARGNSLCYPDGDPVDRAARHEPDDDRNDDYAGVI